MKRAVFLDRDGVINRAIVREGKPYPPANLSELEILPGVSEALEQLHAANYLLIVVTNQPDVARGTAKKEDIAKMVNQKTEVGKNPIKSKLSREMRGETDHRSLFDIPVDAPLKACASKSWGSGYIAVSGSGANGIGRPVVNNWGAVTTNYTFEIGATEGCVSLEADFSGWYLKIETFLFILFMLCLCN